jgi:hypothetical protein
MRYEVERSGIPKNPFPPATTSFLEAIVSKYSAFSAQLESGIIRYAYDRYVGVLDKYECAVTAETTAEEALPELDGTTCIVPTVLIGALIAPHCHVPLPAPRKRERDTDSHQASTSQLFKFFEFAAHGD